MNNKHLLIALGLLLACNHATYAQKGKSKEAKTTFQTSEPWKPETDVRADATMVYGTLDKPGVTFEQRIQSWRDKGYLTEFMTGVAWGDYKDYFLGKWDGVDGHLKEGQRDRNGNEIAHGHLIPYIVPTESFIRYMQETQIKRVIDAGITSIYLEEPESYKSRTISDTNCIQIIKSYICICQCLFNYLVNLFNMFTGSNFRNYPTV